ncbi:MAG: DUF11 domain-containing protein [Anaerolineae bacterium]|nr:DUF11 domain-containing protein [Anaerolineae bacterium]
MLAMISSAWVITQAQAQIDSFTFFIPYPSEQLDDLFDAGFGGAPSLANADIETTISIAIHKSNTFIYYDEWEDDLETNLNAPIQTSTKIWGDRDASNGIPPGFGTTDAEDVLTEGDVIVLTNSIPAIRDPLMPFYFDGGDMLTSAGGAVAVTMAVWPLNLNPPPIVGILYAGAWELYPTNRWGREYRLPIGEDLAAQRPGFTVVGLNVQAVIDNTVVELDLDNDGTFENTVTLDRGQQFNQVSAATPINVGARVLASEPVQVHILSANPASQFEARAYTIVPFNDWTNDLLAPRSSDGDFWLYNPDSSTPLDVIVQSSVAPATTITIPPNSTLKYPPVGLITTATGLRFTATDDRPFYGIAALDDADAQDWGYSLLPIERLATQTLIGWGPGNNNSPPGPDPGPPPSTGNESQVYVTAVTTTTIMADFNNDKVVDATFPVSPLQEVPITDPNDFDMTGAFLASDNGVTFLAVWGQDETANPALPSIDVGTSIVPLPALVIDKNDAPLHDDVDCSGSITIGDIIQYSITYNNNTLDPVANVVIEDGLPAEVAYIPDSTVIISGPSFGPVADSGTTLFPLDEGGINIGALPLLESGALIYRVRITDPTNEIINTAEASSLDLPLAADTSIVRTPLITQTNPLYKITTNLTNPIDGLVTSGDIITFSVALTNTSGLTTTISEIALQDTYDPAQLTFLRATPAPDITASGVITWSDLTNIFGDLPFGATVNLAVTFQVNPVITPTTTIHEVVGIQPQRGDGTSLPTCRDNASLQIRPPAPSLTLRTTPLRRIYASCTGSLASGDEMRFTIEYENETSLQISEVTLLNDLPPALTYVPNSTRLNNAPVPDGGGATSFPLDAGGLLVGNVLPNQSGAITFDVKVNNVANQITNQVAARTIGEPDPIGLDTIVVYSPSLGDSPPPVVVNMPLLEPTNGKTDSGAPAIFGLSFTNSDAPTITALSLEDTFDPNHLIFQSANPSPDNQNSGRLSWNNLTAAFGDLSQNESAELTVNFRTNPALRDINNTLNQAIFNATRSDGTLLQNCVAQASVSFSQGGDDDDDDGGCPNCTPTSTPTPPPSRTTVTPGPPGTTPGAGTPPATSTLPVALLPETGELEAGSTTVKIVFLIALLGPAVLWWVNQSRRDKN